MVAYAIVDVEIHDIEAFLNYQKKIGPFLNDAGGRYLARGGESRVYEGDFEPNRLLLLEFPSLDVLDEFYNSEIYQSLGAEREACCECRIIGVKGL